MQRHNPVLKRRDEVKVAEASNLRREKADVLLLEQVPCADACRKGRARVESRRVCRPAVAPPLFVAGGTGSQGERPIGLRHYCLTKQVALEDATGLEVVSREVRPYMEDGLLKHRDGDVCSKVST